MAIIEPEQYPKNDRPKRQSIPKPVFTALYVAPYDSGRTHVLYGLDYEGRVWRFKPSEGKWEPTA